MYTADREYHLCNNNKKRPEKESERRRMSWKDCFGWTGGLVLKSRGQGKSNGTRWAPRSRVWEGGGRAVGRERGLWRDLLWFMSPVLEFPGDGSKDLICFLINFWLPVCFLYCKPIALFWDWPWGESKQVWLWEDDKGRCDCRWPAPDHLPYDTSYRLKWKLCLKCSNSNWSSSPVWKAVG